MVLALPKANIAYSLDCEDRDYVIRCTLFQPKPDEEREPIGLWSRSPLRAEENYSASERDCIAAVRKLTTLRSYVMSKSVLLTPTIQRCICY